MVLTASSFIAKKMVNQRLFYPEGNFRNPFCIQHNDRVSFKENTRNLRIFFLGCDIVDNQDQLWKGLKLTNSSKYMPHKMINKAACQGIRIKKNE